MEFISMAVRGTLQRSMLHVGRMFPKVATSNAYDMVHPPHHRFMQVTVAPAHHESYLAAPLRESIPPIPKYLQNVYWWAYIHGTSIRLLDHQFLVNLVLWGHANVLRDAALDELNSHGRTLQVACVYGNFTPSLWSYLHQNQHPCKPKTSLDVIDVVPAQLQNLRNKIAPGSQGTPVTLSCYNAESLGFADEIFDQAIFYMLLHEMPNNVRVNSIREACRVLKPGGKMIFIDFHRPTHVWRRLLISMWFMLEPFAKDLWSTEITEWLPASSRKTMTIRKETLCGGLFQKVVVVKSRL